MLRVEGTLKEWVGAILLGILSLAVSLWLAKIIVGLLGIMN